MTSHHEWAENICREHDAIKPFAPENGQALRFKVGDSVIHTNSYGVELSLQVVKLYQPDTTTTQYARGARYFLNWDCYWVPVCESSLRLA